MTVVYVLMYVYLEWWIAPIYSDSEKLEIMNEFFTQGDRVCKATNNYYEMNNRLPGNISDLHLLDPKVNFDLLNEFDYYQSLEDEIDFRLAFSFKTTRDGGITSCVTDKTCYWSCSPYHMKYFDAK